MITYHTETSPLICRANQWTGFYMMGTSVMKELMTTFLRRENFFTLLDWRFVVLEQALIFVWKNCSLIVEIKTSQNDLSNAFVRR